MGLYAVYDVATGQPHFLQPGSAAPALPADCTAILVPDGTVLGPGDAVTGGALVKYVPTLADMKVTATGQAKSVFGQKIAAGYTHTDGHIYQLGADALGSSGIINLSAIAQLCQQALAGNTAAWPAGSFIRDAANNNVVYSPADALTVCTLAGEYVDALRKNYWSISAAIAAAVDQAALAALDVTAGYPAGA